MAWHIVGQTEADQMSTDPCPVWSNMPLATVCPLTPEKGIHKAGCTVPMWHKHEKAHRCVTGNKLHVFEPLTFQDHYTNGYTCGASTKRKGVTSTKVLRGMGAGTESMPLGPTQPVP